MARGGICGVGNGRKAMLAEGGGQRGAFPLTHLRVALAVPAGVFNLLVGCLIGKWDKRRPPVL